jgi:2-oxoglutarate ferredoxin oxidoreductase subunit delta
MADSGGQLLTPGRWRALTLAAHLKEIQLAKGFVAITAERCKGCGFCVEFCPTRVLALSSAFNSKGYHPPHVVAPEKCSGCDLCGMYCPDFAIFGTRHAR